MKGPFHDQDLNSQFAMDGYVVAPLLNRDEVLNIGDRIGELTPTDLPPFFSPHRGDNSELRSRYHEVLTAACTERFDGLFRDQRALLGICAGQDA